MHSISSSIVILPLESYTFTKSALLYQSTQKQI
jgi:hypothetical protein